MKLSQAESLALVLTGMLDTKGIVGFKIARNLRMLNDELKEFNEKKMELFQKYGEEKDGQLIIDKGSKNYPLYLEEIKPYEEHEVEFNFRIITEEELSNSELTAEQMYVLSDYMVE